MIAAPSRATVVGVVGQRAIADDRVLRVGVDVEHRRVVERDADRPQLRGQRRGEPRRQRASPLRPSAAIGGHSVNGASQPRDAPAFLIDADPERQLRRQRLDVVRQLGHLLGRLDVARRTG